MTQTASGIEVRQLRILVVDDMPDNLFLINGLLEDRYEVLQANSGKAAIDIAISYAMPDLILLDIMMPDMDGYEVLRRLRQHPPTAHIPIIFLTALASSKDERLGLDLGALDYLTKPVNPVLVIERLDAHLRAIAQARRVEELAERLAAHLTPESWRTLFKGPELGFIRFEQKEQTVLYVDADQTSWSAATLDSFEFEIRRLAVRHRGVVDRFAHGAAVVFFDEPGACVKMSMELQRTTSDMHLRAGIHTQMCDVASFRCEGMPCRTLIGGGAREAAKVATTAAVGSIAVSPQTYLLVQEDIHNEGSACLLMEEFHDSDLAQVLLTPTPVKGAATMSTFAGLGQL
jgi:CheY-like chemotaxis protein